MEKKKYYQIASLEKGIRILEIITEHGEMTVTKASTLMGINRASAHRFITTLRDLGYVRKNQNNNYEPTFRMLEMGMKQADKFQIRRMAKPIMRDLAAEFDETVNLGILDQGQMIYLDKVESRELLRMDSGVGSSCHPCVTALGKAMVAFLPEEELKIILETMGGKTIVSSTTIDHERFLKELSKIRRSGYAVDDEELAQDLYCVGAPIFDFNGYPAYALSISGPVRRLKHLKQIPIRLIEATGLLSKQIGFKGGLKF